MKTKSSLFAILLFFGCAASLPQDRPKEFLEQCAIAKNYVIETNGELYRLLWPSGDVAGYFATKEEAEEARDVFVWNAYVVLEKMKEKWERVQ